MRTRQFANAIEATSPFQLSPELTRDIAAFTADLSAHRSRIDDAIAWIAEREVPARNQITGGMK